MADTDYVFQSDFALRNQAEGGARAVLIVLAARDVHVPEGVRKRITGCRDLAEIDKWLAQAATAKSAYDLFG